jgi:hypothetical protein
VIALALIVVSVFIILLCAVEGCAIATWSSPEGGVRHSSSNVSGDEWSDRDGVGGEEVGEGLDWVGVIAAWRGATYSTEVTGAGAVTGAAAVGVETHRGGFGSLWTVLLLDALGEGLELRSFDVEEPLEVRAHLVLHLIHLLEGVAICLTIHQDFF